MVGNKEARRSRDTIDKLSDGYLMAEAPGIAQDLAKVKKLEAETDVKVRQADAEDAAIRLEAREMTKEARKQAVIMDEATKGIEGSFLTVESLAQCIGFACPPEADAAATTRAFFDRLVTPMLDAVDVEWVMKPTDPLAPIEPKE